ncbi:UNVERIFIED_CONTAM: CTD nuclear envelope phosphatase 1, partial [Eudyptes pachyrhynchus]
MMRTQCLLGLRTFVAFATKLWSFLLYMLRRQVRTVIQYQTVRYDVLPLSPVSRNRLNQVKRKILVLDLDETLIHSHHDGVLRPTVRPGTPPDFILKVGGGGLGGGPQGQNLGVLGTDFGGPGGWGGSSGSWSPRWGGWGSRGGRVWGLQRQNLGHCTLELGSYIKDLSVVHSDLSSIVILDNSPGAYRSHPGTAPPAPPGPPRSPPPAPHPPLLPPDNAIPIKSWFSDPSDTALLNLLPMLDALRFTADVRSVLSRNLHQHRLW